MTEVVAALIRRDGKILICQRPADRSRGSMWEFAGGKVEDGETKEKALARECREKIGIRVHVGSERCDVVYNYPDIAVHLTLLDAELIHGTPKTKCVSEIRWVSEDQLRDYDFCPADTRILEKLLPGSEPEVSGKETVQ